jgi:O-antigen/teichoic acid export membrane protein
VSSYGYWQMYVFYTSYIGLFCLGYNDGVYLRYGGYNYEDIPDEILRPANWLYLTQLGIFSIITLIVVNIIFKNKNEIFVMTFVSLNIIIMGIYGLIIYILQVTNQFKKYSIFSVIDKVFVLLIVILMFLCTNDNYKIIVITDFIVKTAVVSVLIFKTKMMWIGKSNKRQKEIFLEYKNNISAGIVLMFASLMSMLMTGGGRLIVQTRGNIDEFGIYSFGISVTGLILTAVTAFSLVLYPTIKRFPKENYQILFTKTNVFIRSFGVISFLLYFPVFYFVSIFYTKYIDVLKYLNLLFCIVYLQGKIGMLNNTFYKVLREEKAMLYANISCIVLFFTVTIISFYFIPEIRIIALCTFIVLLVRCFASEVYLRRKVALLPDKRTSLEIMYICIFAICTGFLDTFTSLIIIILLSFLYFGIEHNNIYQSVLALLKRKS